MIWDAIHLLKTRRFLPIFAIQFFAALNDNLFRFAMIVVITYVLTASVMDAATLSAMVGAIFILPFFLFSASAGLLADRFDRVLIIRLTKILEIVAMAIATYGFFNGNITVLMFSLFLLGFHSAIFGPIKYSILPDILENKELISANALVSGSTFLAILIGTILGSTLITHASGESLVSGLCLLISLTGLVFSFFLPKIKPNDNPDQLSLNIIKNTYDVVNHVRHSKLMFLTILAISWFWFVGSVFLAQIAPYTKNIILGDSHVVALFLVTFSLGVAGGDLLCIPLLKGEVNAKYVPVSALLLTLFIVDLFFASKQSFLLAQQHPNELIGIGRYFSSWQNWRILFDMFFIGVCGGVFIVPLYTLMQVKALRSHRSRVIAVGNIISSLAIVLGAIVMALLFTIGLSIPQVFLLVGLLNGVVAIYICKLVPEAVVKSVVRWVLKTIYRVKVTGIKNYHQARSRTVVISNHISMLDGLLLTVFLPDKMIMVMTSEYQKKFWLKPFFILFDAFLIDPSNPMHAKSLIQQVKQNRRCIIFPEGRVTATGGLMKVYESPGVIADKADADILPVRISGAQYSPFSLLRGKVRTRWFPKITIAIQPPRKLFVRENLSARQRREMMSNELYDIMAELMFDGSDYTKESLFESLISAGKIHGNKMPIIEDINRSPLRYCQLISRSFVLGNYIAKETTAKEVVGILLPNTIAVVASFFAILSRDRVPAMLNFATGYQNIRIACRTAQIRRVYTSRKFIETAELSEVIRVLTEDGINIVYLEDLKTQIKLRHKLIGFFMGQFAQYFYRKMNPTVNSNDTAVILFTSGSEGTPKAVLLSHGNIQANRYQLTALIDFNSNDKVFNLLPVFHTFGLTGGMLLPLLSGIKIFLYPSPLHYRVVPELIYDTSSTILFGTDTFLSGYARNAHPYDFYSLRYVFAGAEKLKTETRLLWNEKFGVRVFEGYGATETSPGLAVNTAMYNKAGTVGRFLPKISYRLEPVEGIARGGRLFIKAPNVMKGYYLADNPAHLVAPTDGWYDTGDIVDVDEEGFVTILDRAKRFAKIGGEMISLTAVESYVTELWPEQSHAVISVFDDKKGEQLVLLTSNLSASREALIAFFKRKGVGELYLPKKIFTVEEMFLLPSGKIDYSSVKSHIDQQMKLTEQE